MAVPAVLKVVHLKPMRKSAYLGHLAHEVGWMYQVVTREKEGEGQDPLLEEKTAHEIMET